MAGTASGTPQTTDGEHNGSPSAAVVVDTHDAEVTLRLDGGHAAPSTSTEAADEATTTAAATTEEGPWPTVRDWLVKLVPAVAGSVGLVGFIGFVGAALTWWRYWTAGLPANQALKAVPMSERLISGAGALAVFMVLGALAVAAVYAIDAPGRPTGPMRQGLGALVTVETVLVIWALPQWTDGHVGGQVWATVIVLAWGAAGWAVCQDSSEPSGIGTIESPFSVKARASSESFSRWFRSKAGAPLRLAGAVTMVLGRRLTGHDKKLTWESFKTRVNRQFEELTFTRKLPEPIPLSAEEEARWTEHQQSPEEHAKSPQWAPGRWQEPPNFRWVRRLSPFGLTADGVCAALTFALLWLATGEWVIPVSFAAACVLAGLIFGVCAATKKFWPYGVAVFVSVCLFGAFVEAAQLAHQPQGQPVAVLRAASDTPMVGLYVADSSDGIWLAPTTAVLQRHCRQPGRGSGSIALVATKDVAHYAIGGATNVCQALKNAGALGDQLLADFR